VAGKCARPPAADNLADELARLRERVRQTTVDLADLHRQLVELEQQIRTHQQRP